MFSTTFSSIGYGDFTVGALKSSTSGFSIGGPSSCASLFFSTSVVLSVSSLASDVLIVSSTDFSNYSDFSDFSDWEASMVLSSASAMVSVDGVAGVSSPTTGTSRMAS